MRGTLFGCYFSIGTNQDVDSPVLLDHFLSLMAQYYWLFPEKDCLHWLQPEILSCHSSHKINSLFSFCESLRTTCLHSFFSCWVSIRVDSETQVCGGSVVRGHTRTRRAAWVSPGSRIVLGARIFIRLSYRLHKIVLVR